MWPSCHVEPCWTNLDKVLANVVCTHSLAANHPTGLERNALCSAVVYVQTTAARTCKSFGLVLPCLFIFNSAFYFQRKNMIARYAQALTRVSSTSVATHPRIMTLRDTSRISLDWVVPQPEVAAQLHPWKACWHGWVCAVHLPRLYLMALCVFCFMVQSRTAESRCQSKTGLKMHLPSSFPANSSWTSAALTTTI